MYLCMFYLCVFMYVCMYVCIYACMCITHLCVIHVKFSTYVSFIVVSGMIYVSLNLLDCMYVSFICRGMSFGRMGMGDRERDMSE